MAEKSSADQAAGGEERGFGRGRRPGPGGRGGAGRGRRPARGDKEEAPWIPVTKLGRLVKDGRIKYLEEIYLHSLPVKEPQIIDTFLKKTLKDEVIKIAPVQKQTRAGQRTKFRAIVVVGDMDGHVGLGAKTAKEVAHAIRGGIVAAKLSVLPVRRGYWGSKLGKPHTVPCKVNGACGSVKLRFAPAPRGTGIVAAPTVKRIIQFAGVEDVYTIARGSTKTQGNFAGAAFDCLRMTYAYLTPDLWPAYKLTLSPFQQHTDFLSENDTFGAKKTREEEEEERTREPRREGRFRRDGPPREGGREGGREGQGGRFGGRGREPRDAPPAQSAASDAGGW